MEAVRKLKQILARSAALDQCFLRTATTITRISSSSSCRRCACASVLVERSRSVRFDLTKRSSDLHILGSRSMMLTYAESAK